jgi:hypothetical protein
MTPNSMTCAALASFKDSRPLAPVATVGAGSDELTSSQSSRSLARRECATLPVISAALIAPIEMPATQVGS